ncbi:hypothetical protein OZ411_01470 [Bradyrhizobium sp. Arg237L]|uniref:hypothetical protein n=1 Tax=Bradyrhizobium sp. Arg237L TaxID=3003352 RepID=UPI00249E9A3E|nr:hypothetical protein [Bradyrhizobium sp. Arg237L]MDI4231482.1 hypothetical protein [Bradyrhizobium sp. Arg237L]
MTTRRARTRFRVAEHASGQPFIVLEPLSGDDLQLFSRSIGFDLPQSTTFEEAQEIAKYLNNKLVQIAEW